MSASVQMHSPAGAVLPQQLAGMDGKTPVLLGFSGGADSSALLFWLAGESRRVGFPLLAAHLNHGIRGKEAERDLLFCERIARKFGVEFVFGTSDVPARVLRTGESLEEAARSERYAFFEGVMKERGIPLLVTAHHADDNLETLLFRISRGTGASGLVGILPVRPFGEGVLVRPFLSLTKAEILEYCAQNGIEYVTDSTNGDVSYARNRLRACVTPVLEEMYPGVAQRSARLLSEVREDEAYLSELAKDFLKEHAKGARLRVPRADALPTPVLRRVLLFWAEPLCGSLCAVHREALLRLVKEPTPCMEVLLPCNKVCRREKDELLITDGGVRGELHIREPLVLGIRAIGETGFSSDVRTVENGEKIHNLSTVPYTILTDGCDMMKKGLFWRVREDGDVIFLRGMHRKLRRLQAEAEIPVQLRKRLPLLCDGDGVLWAPYVGVRDGAAGEMHGLLIRLIPAEE